MVELYGSFRRGLSDSYLGNYQMLACRRIYMIKWCPKLLLRRNEMAAYAALVSLMNTMDQVQIHPRFSTSFNKNQLESLGDTVGILLDFIESYKYGGGSNQVEDLEAEIASAAHAAEDIIESHIVDQILVESTKKYLKSEIASAAHEAEEDVIESHIVKQIHTGSTKKNLQKVTRNLDSIKENVIGRFKDQKLTCSTPPPPSPPDASSRPGKTTSMVGFDDYMIQLMDKLTRQQSRLQVIPIIGMGGVGKTTLARNAYENLLIKQHFDVCAWATISQNYSGKEVLLELLSSQEFQDQEGRRKFVALNEQELGEKLHKCLFNRRYLIILDDMWGIEVWDDMKFFFPDNSNGSRIVVTTRLLNIALHFDSSYHTVNLLDEDKSWNLFCQESFGEEGCPCELEEVGKKICENCKGLPLSIVVIGGFLRKSCKSREYWEGVARDTYSILNSEEDNKCMRILSLSYTHLPAHLKPCFLYMGIFREDESVPVSQLIKLWVGEGFLRPNDGQSLEEVGEVYLKDLVDRNLLLVTQWGCNGKMKACNIHDLVRELCLSVAEKEKFLCIAKLVCTPEAIINRERRVVIHGNMSNRKISLPSEPASRVRSLICEDYMRLDDFKLLRVLCNVDNIRHRGFLKVVLRCVNLRYLDHHFVMGESGHESIQIIPRHISLLWNLQTVRIRGYCEQIIAPSEIWEMVQLRHVQVKKLYIPDPPWSVGVDLVLSNLQTLWEATNLQLNEEVCTRIPNVKKLHLLYSELPQRCDAASYYCPQNLGQFHKLESLTLRFERLNWRRMVLNMAFPTSLKKLTMFGCDLDWKDLEMIGSLPNLEVLKLRTFAMKGSEWSPVEGQFRCLKILQIYFCTLTGWNADHFHFPVLEELFLHYMYDLDEIPSGIGEIPTLRIIRLFYCGAPIAFSAMKILEEQESLGNNDLKVEVVFYILNEKDPVEFREMVEEEGFTSNNLHIKLV